MKIVAMVGGLGAQIIQYMFFLSLKELAKNEEILIDTSSFAHLKCWNGYELEKIFGIRERDVWEDIRKEKSGMNTENQNYRDDVLHYCYSKVDRNCCFYYKGRKKRYTKIRDIMYDSKMLTGNVFQIAKKVTWYWRHMLESSEKLGDIYPEDYFRQRGVTYYDDFCHISDQYLYKDKEVLRSIFRFPALDEKNKAVADKMCASDSVALHVRRSDHMYDNKNLFSRGYFKEAVSYMRSKLKACSFYIFSEDMEWCRDNLRELGIEASDEYVMVDWNQGSASYRDMQLMTYCKNNILVMSSFSWCGYYFSVHKDKTVIAPNGWWLEVPIHM